MTNPTRTLIPVVGLCCAGIGCPGNTPQEVVEVHRLADTWQAPPADADPSGLFPPSLAGYQLEKPRDATGLKDFEFTKPGMRGVYRSDSETIDVFVFRDVNKGDWTHLYKNRVASDGSSSRPGHMRVLKRDGQQYELFHKDGWLVVFHAPRQHQISYRANLPFAKAFLEAIPR